MSASERTPADEVPSSPTSFEAMVADIQRIIAEGDADDPASPRPGLSAEGQAVRMAKPGSRRRPAGAGLAASIAGVAVLALGGLAWLATGGVHQPAPPSASADRTAGATEAEERDGLRQEIEKRDAEIARLAAYTRELEAQQADLRAQVEALSRRASPPGAQATASAEAVPPPTIVAVRIMGLDGAAP
jgi:hypothetical protein